MGPQVIVETEICARLPRGLHQNRLDFQSDLSYFTQCRSRPLSEQLYLVDAGLLRLFDHMTILPVTYGYARVSKADDDARTLETQLGILAEHGIRKDLIFSDVASGQTMNRTGWLDLMSQFQPGDTIVVAFLDRFSRNFEEVVRIQAKLTGRGIGIVAVRENIDTTDESPAGKFFRRSMLAEGAYQVDSVSERIKLGLDRARAGGKQVGRPPALTQDQVEQCRRMADEGSGLRHIARVIQCSPATVKSALDAVAGSQGDDP